VASPGLHAWRSFLRAHVAVISAIERELKRQGLIPLIWYDVLVAISSAPGRKIRMSSLARELVLTRSGATRLVDKLEAAKLVQRESAIEDGRGAVATLTPAGREALRAAWPIYARGINQLFLSHLSARDVNTFARVFDRVRQAAVVSR
jgi:DNA-binding MarR family transcriptional regulator